MSKPFFMLFVGTSRRVLGLRLALISIAASGCSASQIAGGNTQAGQAGAGASCQFVKRAREPVLVDCTEKVVLRNAGDGFRPPAPAGSACNGEVSLSLTLGSRKLEWSRCVSNSTTPWTLETGARVLSQPEYDDAHRALVAVKVWDGMSGCGADKPTLTIDIVTKSSTQQYTDSFYSCTDPDKLYVDEIDGAYMAASTLAHP